MLAAYYTGQKSFAVEETVPRPPTAGEVQLDVAYCGICGTDLHVYLGHMATIASLATRCRAR